MSQAFWHTKSKDGRPVEVMAGWDRPLHVYFMTIFYMDTPEEDVLWSALQEYPEDCGTHTTAPLVAKVAELVDPVPPSRFWEYVERQEGNVKYPAHTFVD